MRLNNVHIESLMDPGSLKVKKGFFFIMVEIIRK